MPKFLHEYLKYRNGKIKDNGWWEIQGDRLVNSAGGWHDYTPSDNDEIRECEWSDILKETLIDNTRTTGWIAPDGAFYGCAPWEHQLTAENVLGFSERELEDMGYIKIFENPRFLRLKYPEYGRYDYFRGDGRKPTAAQAQTLKAKGLEIE